MDSSLKKLFELYLVRSDLRPASVKFKRQALFYFVSWFGDITAGGVTAAMAEDYRSLLSKGRSKITVNGYISNFKPFWKWLKRHNIIQIDPFDNLELYKVTMQTKETFTASELARLVKIANDLWRLRICLGLLGCRRGEMFHVQVRDINLGATEPHLLLSPKKKGPNTVEWGLKDHAIRYVALPEIMAFDGQVIELHKIIVTCMEKLPSDQPYLCLEEKYFRRLIRRQADGSLTDDDIHDPTGNFQRSFRLLQKRAMIQPPKRYHELRAAFATKLIDSHGLSRAADALGHSSCQTTRKYDRKSAMSLVRDIAQVMQNCYQT